MLLVQVFCPKNQELAQLLLDKKLIAQVKSLAHAHSTGVLLLLSS
jgi:hypothetical protein